MFTILFLIFGIPVLLLVAGIVLLSKKYKTAGIVVMSLLGVYLIIGGSMCYSLMHNLDVPAKPAQIDTVPTEKPYIPDDTIIKKDSGGYYPLQQKKDPGFDTEI